MPRTSDLNEELGQVEYVFSEACLQSWCRVQGFRVRGINLVYIVRDLECTMVRDARV